VNFSLPAGVLITWLREIMSAGDDIYTYSPIENTPPFVGLFVFVEEGLNSFGSLSLRDLVDIRNLEHGSVEDKGSAKITSLQMVKHLRCHLS
jgi:hypothetical protein